MITIEKDATHNTPYLRFDGVNGVIEIKGRSLPEDCSFLFQPLLEWLDNYMQKPSEKTVVNFHFEYYNTRSSKYIWDILKKMETLYKEGHNVQVNWICESDDVDMLDAGEDYQAIFEVPFRIREIEN